MIASTFGASIAMGSLPPLLSLQRGPRGPDAALIRLDAAMLSAGPRIGIAGGQ
ncbi:MAG: hypothetical protein ACOY3L_15095 [Pseudomonadota bacterium]